MLHILHSNEFKNLTWLRSGKNVNMVCPNGHIINLKDYKIYSSGMVAPNVICTHFTCNFNEFIILDGWTSNINKRKVSQIAKS